MIRSVRALVAASSAVLIVSALAGCAASQQSAGEPASAETPEVATPTAAPSTPTPTPTSTPTPTADPADVTMWKITDTAVGPFSLGQSETDAVALGEAFGWDLSGVDDDCQRSMLRDGPGVRIVVAFVDDVVAAIEVTRYQLPEVIDGWPGADDGFDLFTTRDEVVAAHPDATPLEDSRPDTDYLLLPTDAPGSLLVEFDAIGGTDVGGTGFDLGTVTAVEVTSIENVRYPEHC